MPGPTHQLVVQFPQLAFPAFDDVLRYEDKLIEVLADVHDVDGHDMGVGEVNFFVLTDDPTSALTVMHGAGDGSLLSHSQVRVAARLMNCEVYVPMWPIGDEREFSIA